MKVCTKAKLIGNISVKEITRFVAEHFECAVNYAGVSVNNAGPKSDWVVKQDYDLHNSVLIVSGFIQISVPFENNEKVKYDMFYSNMNIKAENDAEREYCASLGFPEMAEIRTTYVSIEYDTLTGSRMPVDIICSLTKEFGGWYVEDESADSYKRIVGRREKVAAHLCEKRCDIMVDIETLGTSNDAPVFQIAAVRFNIETGKIIDTFNKIVNPKEFNNIEGGTLLWWLKTNPELLMKLFESANCENEKMLFEEFVEWVNGFVGEVSSFEDVYMWGNGILFDNRIISNKCNKYGLKYPVHYRNDRDMRTIVELASIKSGYVSELEYRKSFEFDGEVHNALDDARYQAMILHISYKILIGGLK